MWRAVLVCVLLLAGVASAAPIWPQAVGYLDEHECTVWAVRPKLLVTASHCVLYPGSTHNVTYWRGVRSVTLMATVVYDNVWADGEYIDLALLVPEENWPAFLPLSGPLPTFGDILTSLSISLGVEQWRVPVEYIGLYRQSRYGWSLIGRTEAGPGASGSPWILRGQVVGVQVAGAAWPRLSLAVPVGSLRRVIRFFDENGPMQKPF